MAPTAVATPDTITDKNPQTDFVLDVRVLEGRDLAGLINMTNDGCGSTCGACTTGGA
jgi:FxLD family lantipeptide